MILTREDGGAFGGIPDFVVVFRMDNGTKAGVTVSDLVRSVWSILNGDLKGASL